MKFNELFEEFSSNREVTSSIEETPINLLFRFKDGQVSVSYENNYQCNLENFDKSNQILNLDSKLSTDELGFPDFEETALNLGFKKTKRIDRNGEFYLWMGYEETLNYKDWEEFDKSLDTQEKAVEYVSDKIEHYFDQLKHRVNEGEIKCVVFYWSDGLEEIFINYQHIPDADFELSDFDVTIGGGYLDLTEFNYSKQIFAEEDDPDDAEFEFDLFKDEVLFGIEEKLSKHPLLSKDAKIGSCHHDLIEFDELYNSLYGEESE